MNINLTGRGRVVIDGKEFTGRNVKIDGNKVIIDGEVQDGELIGDVSIKVFGNVETLNTTSGDVTARNVGSIKTTSGDVECGNVSGSISTMSGDVDCEDISGDVSTMSGDVSYKSNKNA
jgi:hypothetical protein